MLQTSSPTTNSLINPQEIEAHLKTLSQWWLEHTLTDDKYTFVGEVSHDGIANPKANKGIILTTRMLWFFSESAKTYQHIDAVHSQKLEAAATVLFQFICQHFIDKEYGGVFWELDCYGKLINGRKQVYAQSFAVYAFAAYYTLTHNSAALEQAMVLFSLIEQHSLDTIHGGYHEALSQTWGPLEDLRLSNKDLNSAKTMNTHLHVLEAYTGLFSAHKNSALKIALTRLLACYVDRFYNDDTGHFKMFQSIDWQDESTHFSYGHDIESSWLVWEAAEALEDPSILKKYKPITVKLATTCMQAGLNQDGSVMDMHNIAQCKDIPERIWWVQAEALVGFTNAYQLTGDSRFATTAHTVWAFIKDQIVDNVKGEWHSMAQKDQHANYKEYKVGFWKGPYHNGRALLELYQRATHTQH
ncbi:AGE family epimerase/isomerase [Marinagarivorans algicola]|uniref:AGE family epimerase/isomerase n=1 Tax=Marinagarivorans algicola TaxID=1513270 RepID=UPI0006B98E36|nr:AGE family epimerase/isomerase [Marinagarivorans algicola]